MLGFVVGMQSWSTAASVTVLSTDAAQPNRFVIGDVGSLLQALWMNRLALAKDGSKLLDIHPLKTSINKQVKFNANTRPYRDTSGYE